MDKQTKNSIVIAIILNSIIGIILFQKKIFGNTFFSHIIRFLVATIVGASIITIVSLRKNKSKVIAKQ